jgi:hypothetical protein
MTKETQQKSLASLPDVPAFRMRSGTQYESPGYLLQFRDLTDSEINLCRTLNELETYCLRLQDNQKKLAESTEESNDIFFGPNWILELIDYAREELVAKEDLSDILGLLTISLTSLLLQLEPRTFEGLKGALGRKTGHEQVHGTRDQKNARWNAMQHAVDQGCSQYPQRSYSDICIRVAKRLGVSSKTVKRHTTNPRRRQR